VEIHDYRLSLQTTILSDRSFRATSYVYNYIYSWIGVYWLTISKRICPPSNSIYITNSGTCNTTC
jgi:hypothetical protein